MKRPAIGIVLILTFGVSLAGPLKIAKVSAPAINCKFDTDCNITVKDMSTDFTLPGTTGNAFLQSRLFPPGEAGTAAAGLHAYLYRIDLRNLVGAEGKRCIIELSIPFGAAKSIDYDGDGQLDQVFVTTSGGLGVVGPVSANQVGNKITFTFETRPCSGSAPGKGESSFFFGLASAQAPTDVTATLKDTSGGSLSLKAKAPLPTPPPQGSLKNK